MFKTAFKDYIWKPHCVFFRDGEKEEMACHGAVIAQRLVKNNTISPQRGDNTPGEKDLRFNIDDDIIRLVCANCPFENQDCELLLLYHGL